jgi:hypothetical protein
MPRAIFDGREIGKLDFDERLGTKEQQMAEAEAFQRDFDKAEADNNDETK